MMNEIFAAVHGKPEPADFYDSIDMLTEHSLLYRLLIGFENAKGSNEEICAKLGVLPEAVYRYWHSGDHGITHSRQVMKRAMEISQACPNLNRLRETHDIEKMDFIALFTWASIIHDIGRFLDRESGLQHQIFGANLAYHCFRLEIDENMAAVLDGMIRHHDYICEFVDGEELPMEFMENPLAEIFRLADKTSLPPAEEIVRWYDTGKQTDTLFFDNSVLMFQRFDFRHDWNWDYFQYFLLFFAIQPKNWFFAETSNLYREWSNRKSDAAAKIIDLAREESIAEKDIEQMRDVMYHFTERFCLPRYAIDF